MSTKNSDDSSQILLSRALSRLITLAEFGKQESMVVMFPRVSGRTKGQSKDPYGDDAKLNGRLARRSPEEEPLESQPPPSSSSSSSSSTASSAPASTPTPSQAPNNSTTKPLKHNLPICYNSLDACISTTNNCSSHGECYKKYSSLSEDGEGSGKDCFACKCKPSVTRDSDTNVKKVYWGGAACQKKDVSMPFFLLAGISIFLVTVISYGIGLLFSIGQETLPSVLGAGVAGVKPK